MFLLLLVLLIAAVVAGAGLVGVGALSADRRRRRTGLLAALSAPVVLVGTLVMLAVLVVGFGRGGGGGSEQGDGAGSGQTNTTAPRPAADREAATLPDARLQPFDDEFAVVRVDAGRPFQAVGGLPPGGAVRVQASGFGGREKGLAEQCVTELGRNLACGRALTVQFDWDGRADFLFVVRGEIAPGGCRVGTATCLLRVRTADREALTQIVLTDRPVPGRVTLAGAGGDRVSVAVTGYPPASRATAVLCAATAETYDTRRCSASPLASFPIDAGGSGGTTVVVTAGRVGTDDVACGARSRCRLLVLVEPGYVAGPGAAVPFPDGPGVAYAPGRVLTGVVVAVVLLGLAALLAVRTDWTKPTEAATPELDRSDLRVADSLDDLFGTDAELDERDPVPW